MARTGKTLDIKTILTPDNMAVAIAQKWQEWDMLRDTKKRDWEEVRKYIFATDTTKTSNAKLPWKNKTTVPKLTQIRDNLFANYMKSLFPKKKWLTWEGDYGPADTADKIKAIESYMCWVVERSEFETEMAKLVLDYIDYGNAIATVDWYDGTQDVDTKTTIGYVGPIVKRISPLDIVFNPIAPDFASTPKIIRSLVSLGELKKIIEAQTKSDDAGEAATIYNYLRDLRKAAATFTGELIVEDDYLAVDGFTDYRSYLASDYAEVLTFYGDFYNVETGELLENHVITVVDRHKLIGKKPNPSFFGSAPIHHVGWRIRQDNLWAMGPLDNLVGMQYRIDHLENLKADVFDLTAFPVLKIKGLVEEFNWEPMARIYVGDEGDVDMVAPDVNSLNADMQIEKLEQQMEEMAGSPKEAMGIRTPGEKTKYEVQRLENAAGRIFQHKSTQFEYMEEKVLADMLELGRRKVGKQTIRVMNDDLKVASFMELTADDIAGAGRIRPVAARHFAEQADKIQNVTNFFNSQVALDPSVSVHFSGLKLAKMFEGLLELDGYELVTPFVRVTENADAQKLGNSAQEQVESEIMTPAGISPEDATLPNGQGSPQAPQY